MNNNTNMKQNTNKQSYHRVIETNTSKKDGQHVCPNCGASDITFSEKKGKLYCNYCASEFDGKKLNNIVTDLSNLEGTIIGSGAQNIKAEAKDIITLKCGGCGAEVVIDTKTTSQARCHWCRSILSINSRIENGSIPDAILPFSIKKEEAKKSIEDFVNKRRFFAHPKFKEEFTTENIMGVYFPYMLVDARAHCYFDGEGEHLVRTYTIDDSRYYDATLHKISRIFDITIDNLTVESNKGRINKHDENQTNNIINSIMPFDTENCIEFRSNYLVGYTSEKRNISIPELDTAVGKQIKDIARHAINQDLKYYNRGVKWSTEEIKVIGSQWLAIYLPVWLYSYHEKKDNESVIHYVAVNARTKETMGSVPINKTRLFIFSAIIEFILGAIGIFLFLSLAADSDSEGAFLPLLLLASGFVYYNAMYANYRNKEARHSYEKETVNQITNLRKVDHYIKNLNRQSNSKMRGANNMKLEGENIKLNEIKK